MVPCPLASAPGREVVEHVRTDAIPGGLSHGGLSSRPGLLRLRWDSRDRWSPRVVAARGTGPLPHSGPGYRFSGHSLETAFAVDGGDFPARRERDGPGEVRTRNRAPENRASPLRGRVLQGSASLRSPQTATALAGPLPPPDAESRRRARVTPGILPVMPLARPVAWRCPVRGTVCGGIRPPRIGGLRNQLTKGRGWPGWTCGGRCSQAALPAPGPFIPRPSFGSGGEG